MIGTAKTIRGKNRHREPHPITVVTVGLAGMMPKMMDMKTSTIVPQIKKLLVTMGNQIQDGLVEDFSKVNHFMILLKSWFTHKTVDKNYSSIHDSTEILVMVFSSTLSALLSS